jgi:hypothetical protein
MIIIDRENIMTEIIIKRTVVNEKVFTDIYSDPELTFANLVNLMTANFYPNIFT